VVWQTQLESEEDGEEAESSFHKGNMIGLLNNASADGFISTYLICIILLHYHHIILTEMMQDNR
jgi:hypothetical protein